MKWYDLRQYACKPKNSPLSSYYDAPYALTRLWIDYERLGWDDRYRTRPAQVFPGFGVGTTRGAKALQRYRQRSM